MKIDEKSLRAARERARNCLSSGLGVGDAVFHAINAYLEAAKPQPAAPEVVKGEIAIPREPTKEIFSKVLGRELYNMDRRHFAVWAEGYRAIVKACDAISTPPPAPQGDVAEAVAKEREALLAIATERKENAYRIGREAAMCGDIGALIEARCRLKAAKEMEEAIRARAEQKADRA